MFVLPPQSPFLPTSSRDELLKFGDPLQLQCGVKLKEKSNAAKNKTIHNLYELDVNVKYITEQGHVIQRVSETQIVVKKKSTLSSPKNIHNNITNATIPSSNPINIPTTFSAPKTPSMIIPYPKSNPRSVRLGNSSDSSDNLSSIGSYASSFEDGVEFINKSPSMFAHEIKDSFTLTVQIQPTCPGERLEWLVKNVTYFTDNKSFEGSLYITNFQLMFLSSEFRCDNKYNSNMPIWMHTQRPEIEISVPLAAISKFEKVDKQNSHFMFGVGGENCYALDIYTKDFRKTLRFILNPNDPFHSLKDICQRLSVLIFPTDYRKVFAFSCNQPPTVHFESLMGTLESEFKRLGADIPNSGWKFTELNKDYSLCKSYPKTLVVPADMQDDELREVSNFRGKGRIPVLSWRNKATGVSITRTSQPKTGISRSFRCKADERIVELIRKTNMNKDKKLWILDARPMANAFANMALGGGYENMTFYQDSEFKWLGVANIHVVRDSWDKLRTVCETNTKLTCDDNSSNSSWLSQLESTRWLDHVSLILSSTINMVQILDERKESVFIHCSDGWDRTPQLACLAQIMLDKYYRTIKGFCVLIQKEWISFGHKFGERLGLNFVDNTFKDTERSPVFLQFLDAVFQIMQQFPSAFEFTDDLLLTIMEHAYSGKFGTFLFNYESQREEARVNEETPSLWVYILNNTTQYINPFYIAHGEPSVLYPSTSVQKLKFWNRYFLQYLDPQVLSKDQTVQIGRQMRTTIQNLESKVISLEREKEELIKKIKELQGRERALSNGIPVEDQHHHKMELQPSPPKPMSESDSPSKTPDGNDILNEEDFYAIT